MTTPSTPRPRQKLRTRQALLQAAAECMRQGERPSLEEVARRAMISRATAYRYFPKLEALYLEAQIDMDTPRADQILAGLSSSADPVTRLARVDEALTAMTLTNEVPVRMMLAQSLERRARGEADAHVPARQNRRTPLIEAALEPVQARIGPAALKTLQHALALVMGPEAMVVLKDVLELNEAQARKVRRFAIRALVHAALPPDR